MTSSKQRQEQTKPEKITIHNSVYKVLFHITSSYFWTEPEDCISPVGGRLETSRVEEVINGLLDRSHRVTSGSKAIGTIRVNSQTLGVCWSDNPSIKYPVGTRIPCCKQRKLHQTEPNISGMCDMYIVQVSAKTKDWRKGRNRNRIFIQSPHPSTIFRSPNAMAGEDLILKSIRLRWLGSNGLAGITSTLHLLHVARWCTLCTAEAKADAALELVPSYVPATLTTYRHHAIWYVAEFTGKKSVPATTFPKQCCLTFLTVQSSWPKSFDNKSFVES